MAGAGEDFLWKDMIGDVHAYACAWHPSHRNNNGDHGILILVLQVASSLLGTCTCHHTGLQVLNFLSCRGCRAGPRRF